MYRLIERRYDRASRSWATVAAYVAIYGALVTWACYLVP